jgi:hypothetical protein
MHHGRTGEEEPLADSIWSWLKDIRESSIQEQTR